MRIVFMGTPVFSTSTLQALVDAGHEVVAVYTQPPRRANRGKKETRTPVHELADTLEIPVFTPPSMKDDAVQTEIISHNADVGIVIAYGQILPEAVLNAPKHGCLNLHASLLPRWRGAAPIQRAIMAGDDKTGVMVMQMERGLDTGPVGLVNEVTISEAMTAGELHDQLQGISANLAVEALSGLAKETLVFTPQSQEGVTYASKIEKSESRIDWSLESAAVHNHMRGLSPFPGAWFQLGSDRVKVIRSERIDTNVSGAPGTVIDNSLGVACGEGAIQLVTLQRAGKRPLEAEEFLRGTKIDIGTPLT